MIVKDQNLPAILPCPFCGRAGQLYVDEITDRLGSYPVFTVACGRWSVAETGAPYKQCFGQLTLDREGDYNFCWPTAEEAIEAWNTRK